MSDYIRRQDAIDALNMWREKAKHPSNKGTYNNGELDAYSSAISEIENLPAADICEDRHGKCVFCSLYEDLD